jgi:acyl-CoA thioester hydrolase
MAGLVSQLDLRVRYSETDQMGTFYNARALEWFECGRTQWLRQAGLPYADMERRGVFLPLVEARVHFQGRAQYDDELRVVASAGMCGKARLKFAIRISQAHSGAPVASGYTVHAVTDAQGRPIRPPAWLTEPMARHGREGMELEDGTG